MPSRSILASALLWLSGLPLVSAQSSAFTYQGRLNDAGEPAHGRYDFQFTVRDAASGGNAVGVNPLAATLAVSNGLFTVTLDPGAGVFTGADRWLYLSVKTNGAVTASSDVTEAFEVRGAAAGYALQDRVSAAGR